MGAAAFTIPSIFTAIDKFSAPIRGMGNAVQGFVSRSERALGRANMAFSKLMAPVTGLNKLLMGLGYYVGLFTLVRIVKNAIDIFADFQQANADLAVVMGVSVQKNRILAMEARRIGLNYGVAATEVVRMQHALATLGFEQADIMKMGKPLMTGTSALEGADPEKLANTVGALINTFDQLAAGDTQHILDVMALSANRTALNFEKLATTLPIVSGPANAVNISFEETVALLGVLSNAGVHVATSATSLKNIFIDSAKKGHTYAQVIENISKNSEKLTYANKKFGKRSVVSALVLAQKMHDAKNGVMALTKEFKNAELGLTDLIAAERLNTFRGAQHMLNAAYKEFILSIEDGNGPLAKSLTNILKIAAAVLLLSTDSDQAREAITKIDKTILDSAKRWLLWLKVIKWVAIAIISVKAALMVWSAGVTIATAGIWIATTAMKAFSWAIFLVNYAMLANPIGLIIAAVVLIVAVITAAIVKFNEWGAAVLLLLGPLGFLPLVIMTIINHWDRMVNAFKNVGIIAGLKAIGNTILDVILLPLQQIVGLIGKITGANWAISAAEGIENFRTKLASYEGGDAAKITPAINPKSTDQESRNSQTFNGRVWLDINDPGGHVKNVDSDSSFIMPRVTPTNSFQ